MTQVAGLLAAMAANAAVSGEFGADDADDADEGLCDECERFSGGECDAQQGDHVFRPKSPPRRRGQVSLKSKSRGGGWK